MLGLVIDHKKHTKLITNAVSLLGHSRFKLFTGLLTGHLNNYSFLFFSLISSFYFLLSFYGFH